MINISISVFKIKYSCITPTFHMTRLYKDKVNLMIHRESELKCSKIMPEYQGMTKIPYLYIILSYGKWE